MNLGRRLNFVGSSGMVAIAVLVLIIRFVASYEEPRCNETSSVPSARLIGHAFLVQDAESVGDCIDICDKQIQCRSINFNWVNFICELNKANVQIAPQNFNPAKGYVYLDNPWPKFRLRSCAHIQQLVPNAKSGYYWVHIKRKKVQVYCDMDNYGGGWTLVVSISSSSRDHVLRREVNCYSPTRCVEFINSQIPCRKLSDESIHEISTHEGTFRVDHVTGGYSAFYQIPAGAKYFDSECHSHSCPRIIVSHVYPYQWESNCKGILNGYYIHHSGCHRVFDMHDDSECGSRWDSSKFDVLLPIWRKVSSEHFSPATNRVLYAYACRSNYGLADNAAGFLFVK